MSENGRLVLSVYDNTTNWPKPYRQAGYAVICWDLEHEGDILAGFSRLVARLDEAMERGYLFEGMLFAPPCTLFARSGARWWKERDTAPPPPDDTWNELDYACAYVRVCLHLVELYHPNWWALEQPIGRVERLVPELKPFRRLTFDPCDYGDPYTKRTVLFGTFNANLPIKRAKRIDRNYIHYIAPGPGRAAKRSATPKGFARAFFAANSCTEVGI